MLSWKEDYSVAPVHHLWVVGNEAVSLSLLLFFPGCYFSAIIADIGVLQSPRWRW